MCRRRRHRRRASLPRPARPAPPARPPTDGPIAKRLGGGKDGCTTSRLHSNQAMQILQDYSVAGELVRSRPRHAAPRQKGNL